MELSCKGYVGEEVLSPTISNDKMKIYFPIQIIEQMFQVDHVTPKKSRLFKENDANPSRTDLYVILNKHRKSKMISDGNKNSGVEVIWELTLCGLLIQKMTILSLNDFKVKNNLRIDTMNGSDLQRLHNYPIYPRDSKIYPDSGFVNFDNDAQGGTHWTCFFNIKNHSTLTSLADSQINFYSPNYQNQKFIIII